MVCVRWVGALQAVFRATPQASRSTYAYCWRREFQERGARSNASERSAPPNAGERRPIDTDYVPLRLYSDRWDALVAGLSVQQGHEIADLLQTTFWSGMYAVLAVLTEYQLRHDGVDLPYRPFVRSYWFEFYGQLHGEGWPDEAQSSLADTGHDDASSPGSGAMTSGQGE